MHLYGEATRTNWGAGYALVCCMAEEFGVKELQILWQVHLHGEAARCDAERSAESVQRATQWIASVMQWIVSVHALHANL